VEECVGMVDAGFRSPQAQGREGGRSRYASAIDERGQARSLKRDESRERFSIAFSTPSRERERDHRWEAVNTAKGSARGGRVELEEEEEFDAESVDTIEDMELGPFRGLVGPKKLWIAVLFWLVGGWMGLHRLYLDDHAGRSS
jgi:hypothetical protein